MIESISNYISFKSIPVISVTISTLVAAISCFAVGLFSTAYFRRDELAEVFHKGRNEAYYKKFLNEQLPNIIFNLNVHIETEKAKKKVIQAFDGNAFGVTKFAEEKLVGKSIEALAAVVAGWIGVTYQDIKDGLDPLKKDANDVLRYGRQGRTSFYSDAVKTIGSWIKPLTDPIITAVGEREALKKADAGEFVSQMNEHSKTILAKIEKIEIFQSINPLKVGLLRAISNCFFNIISGCVHTVGVSLGPEDYNAEKKFEDSINKSLPADKKINFSTIAEQLKLPDLGTKRYSNRFINPVNYALDTAEQVQGAYDTTVSGLSDAYNSTWNFLTGS